jgi:hypothetical protein
MYGLKPVPFSSIEKHFQERSAELQIPPLRSPDFLWNFVALANFVRLSLREGACVAVVSAARQEIWVRFGRDDKREGEASMESGCRTGGFFITLGEPQSAWQESS